jgi:glycosyltransferase involved in cell wall biosynthesis
MTQTFEPGITTVILTHNEELHLGRCLDYARAFSREIVIVDSFSTDRTLEIAAAHGARVIQNPWTNYAQQFNFALEQGNITTQWVLRLDADEIIGPDLADKLNRDVPTLPETVVGATFDRRHIFMGRWVRHGGRYPLRLLRLWRNGRGHIENRWMDEHVEVGEGDIIHMAGQFDDHVLKDLTFFTAKHNGYATREAIDVLNDRYHLLDGIDDDAQGAGKQAAIKRWIKRNLYNRMPFGTGPLLYLLVRLFPQLGILDGPTGITYHVLQGFWYRFLVDAKVMELETLIADAPDRETRLARLRAATGLKL